jgi:hypothetical protein
MTRSDSSSSASMSKMYPSIYNAKSTSSAEESATHSNNPNAFDSQATESMWSWPSMMNGDLSGTNLDLMLGLSVHQDPAAQWIANHPNSSGVESSENSSHGYEGNW